MVRHYYMVAGLVTVILVAAALYGTAPRPASTIPPAVVEDAEPQEPDGIEYRLVGSTWTASGSYDGADATARQLLDDSGLHYIVENGTLVQVQGDYNSRSFHWVIYVQGVEGGLDSTAASGQSVLFKYQSYMEVSNAEG